MRAQLQVNVMISVPVAATTLEDAIDAAKAFTHVDLDEIPWRKAEYLDGNIEVTGVFDES